MEVDIRHKVEIYNTTECIVFRKTKDPYGWLHNFTKGYPIEIGNRIAYTSEALYQALKFPYDPAFQEAILESKDGYTAKTISYTKGTQECYEYWQQYGGIENILIDLMTTALILKVEHNEVLRERLTLLPKLPIVEISSFDRKWGAVPIPGGQNYVAGSNRLGKAWMLLRRKLEMGLPMYELVQRPKLVKILGEPVLKYEKESYND